MTTLTVTPDGKGNFLVRMWVVDTTLTADELRTLRAAIDSALGDVREDCEDCPYSAPDPNCSQCHGTGAEPEGLFKMMNICRCMSR